MRTRVKICGFTQIEEAIYAAQLGVDAIGLVFYPPSPRNVSIEQAIEITNALPAFVSVVALFVNESVEKINQVLQQVNIDVIQFHGEESAEFCRGFNKPYVKAVRMRENTEVAKLAAEYYDSCGLLLDAYHADAKGGTGSCFDWDLIPKHCELPIILAGGLDAQNARLAIQAVNPYALDVSSGVESAKGIKETAKIAAFLTEVNQEII